MTQPTVGRPPRRGGFEPIEWHATDPFPAEDSANTRLHPFFDHLREGRLTTTRCTACGWRPWPPRVLCPACWSDQLEWVDLPQTGRIHGFTVQETGVPPGFEKPLIFGVVDVDGVRVFARLVDCSPDALQVGDPVAFTVITVPPAPGTAESRVMHAFRKL